MEDWRRFKRTCLIVGSSPTIWMLVFFLIPMGIIWVYSFGEKSGVIDIVISGTFDNYIRLFDNIYLQIFIQSLVISAVTTFICLAIGLPIALCIVYAPKTWQPILLLAIILPFWTNLLIRTYALIAVFREQGYVNLILSWVYNGLFYVTETIVGKESAIAWLGAEYMPLQMLYKPASVVLGLVYVQLPFMVLPLYASLEKLDRSLLEASLDLGASHLQTFFRIVVPLALPGIISGVIITFIPSLGSYLTPALLGGPDGVMIANVIERQFKAANDWPFGAAMSYVLMYITFIIIAINAWLSNRKSQSARG